MQHRSCRATCPHGEGTLCKLPALMEGISLLCLVHDTMVRLNFSSLDSLSLVPQTQLLSVPWGTASRQGWLRSASSGH